MVPAARDRAGSRSTARRNDLPLSVRIVPATTGGPARPKSVEINSHHSRNDEGEHNYDYGGNQNQKRAEKDSEHRGHDHAEQQHQKNDGEQSGLPDVNATAPALFDRHPDMRGAAKAFAAQSIGRHDLRFGAVFPAIGWSICLAADPVPMLRVSRIGFFNRGKFCWVIFDIGKEGEKLALPVRTSGRRNSEGRRCPGKGRSVAALEGVKLMAAAALPM